MAENDVWVQLFQKIDVDRDGIISRDDLRNHALKSDLKPQVFSERWMNLFQEENTGTITWQSFCSALGIKNRPYAPIKKENEELNDKENNSPNRRPKVKIVRQFDDDHSQKKIDETDSDIMKEVTSNRSLHSKPPPGSSNFNHANKMSEKKDDDILSDLIVEKLVKKEEHGRTIDSLKYCRVFDTDMTPKMQEEVVNVTLDELDEPRTTFLKETQIASRLNEKYGSPWVCNIGGVNLEKDVKKCQNCVAGHKFCFSPDDGKTLIFIYKAKSEPPLNKIKNGCCLLCCC